MTTRRSERLLERDADPDAGIKRLKVLAASPDEEAKEEVWRAFFVDYAVPASRDTLELGSIFWRPVQSELLAPYTHRYLDELPDLKGGMLNQGVVIRAMYPHAVGDASFLAAAWRPRRTKGQPVRPQPAPRAVVRARPDCTRPAPSEPSRRCVVRRRVRRP